MALIEIQRFRLVDDATDEAAFLAADRQVQIEFAYQQPGMVRRTTARGADGEWLVVTMWASAEDADAATSRAGSHAAVAAFRALVDGASLSTDRYTTLD